MSNKPSENEEEYIFRLELEKQREAVKKRRAELDDGEREKLKNLHWMRCAKCGNELTEVVFRGVRIDKCFACGGVYLDDGELEQLAGRSSGWVAQLLGLIRGDRSKPTS